MFAKYSGPDTNGVSVSLRSVSSEKPVDNVVGGWALQLYSIPSSTQVCGQLLLQCTLQSTHNYYTLTVCTVRKMWPYIFLHITQVTPASLSQSAKIGESSVVPFLNFDRLVVSHLSSQNSSVVLLSRPSGQCQMRGSGFETLKFSTVSQGTEFGNEVEIRG
jgi:hypothetical protein